MISTDNQRTVYLDYAATTPVDPRVVEKLLLHLSHHWNHEVLQGFGNASSTHHSFGTRAKDAIETARKHLATLVNAQPKTLYWTSGATESINLALQGVANFYKRYGNHIVTCQTEHRATLDTCKFLAEQGFSITYLNPGPDGIIDCDALRAALKPETILVTLMHVNNETGVIQDILQLGKITRERNIIFHVDAAQSLGKLAIDLQTLPVDLMSFSGHKIYGPKGVGALYVRDLPRLRLTPLLHGGGQEKGIRPGTLPTHQIVGMGEACRILQEREEENEREKEADNNERKRETNINEKETEIQRITALRDRLWAGISELPGVTLNGSTESALRVCGILNVRFESCDFEKLLSELNRAEIAISQASACISSTLETSYVLRAMGLMNESAHRSIRFSLGRFTTAAEIDYVIEVIKKSYNIGD